MEAAVGDPNEALLLTSICTGPAEDVVLRLGALATSRGVSIEEFAAQTLASIDTSDQEFAEAVHATIAEHRQILDRLAKNRPVSS